MAFYKTQIAKVSAGYAVDNFGRRLKFIGNYPRQAGDYVWTDGTVIFGNISSKSQPVIFDENPSGIPVLTNQMRGYFNSKGIFRKYPIAYEAGTDEGGFEGETSTHSVVNNDFIVNNQDYYKYGKYNIDDDESTIADIEISENGEVLIAEYKIDDRGNYTGVTIFKDGVEEKYIDAKDYVPKEEGTSSVFVSIKGFKLFPDLEWTMVLAAAIKGSTEIPDACPEL